MRVRRAIPCHRYGAKVVLFADHVKPSVPGFTQPDLGLLDPRRRSLASIALRIAGKKDRVRTGCGGLLRFV